MDEDILKDSNFKPIYLQVFDYIIYEIFKNNFRPGEKLPSIRELSLKLKTNPNTISRSIFELERESIIEIKRGVGSFVTTDTNIIKNMRKKYLKENLEDFLLQMENIGITKNELIEILREYIKETKD